MEDYRIGEVPTFHLEWVRMPWSRPSGGLSMSSHCVLGCHNLRESWRPPNICSPFDLRWPFRPALLAPSSIFQVLPTNITPGYGQRPAEVVI